MLTKKEEKILQLIKDGTLRKRRFVAVIIVFVFFVILSAIFIQKGNAGIKQITNRYVIASAKISKINTATSLEAKLKDELLKYVLFFQKTYSFVIFLMTCLILLLFLACFAAASLVIIIGYGYRDNLIRKLMDSSGRNSGKTS